MHIRDFIVTKGNGGGRGQTSDGNPDASSIRHSFHSGGRRENEMTKCRATHQGVANSPVRLDEGILGVVDRDIYSGLGDGLGNRMLTV